MQKECVHWWLVASDPDGDGWPAVCKLCQAGRKFPLNAFRDEPDSEMAWAWARYLEDQRIGRVL